MKKKLYSDLPPLVKIILLTSEGWLVGGAPKHVLEGIDVKDYDIIVPSRELYQLTTAYLFQLAMYMEVNSFGGLKFWDDDITIDIWCEELDHFVKVSTRFDYVYNLKRQLLITNLN